MAGTSANSMPGEAEVRDALAAVQHPVLRLPITALGLVRGVVVSGRRVRVSLALLAQGSPGRHALHTAVEEAVRGLGVADVSVDFTTMSEADLAALRKRLEEVVPPADAFAGTDVYAISSGKGGVGKSSVCVNLAVAMARAGRRVAVIDADVYGFSVPRMLGIDQTPVIIAGLLVPPEAGGVAVVSVGFFASEGTPVIWRGPMLHKMLEQFVTDVWWGRPEVLLIDMPPGTGDVSLSMAQLFPDAQVVVVTTPQPAAQRVAQRFAYMAQKIKLPVVGVIENMSWFTAPDGARYELFGTGGGRLLAEELGVPLLGQVPLVPALREGGDTGRPVVVADPLGEASVVFEDVCRQLLERKKARVRRAELRIVTTN